MQEKCRVLVVDDEKDFLETIAKRLSKLGFEADTAGYCAEAFVKLAELKPDVVVLDVKMPGMDGIQCLRRIKEKWPSTQVIMLTGHASVNTGVDGMKLGAFDYCLKPFDLDELVMKIQLAYEQALSSRE